MLTKTAFVADSAALLSPTSQPADGHGEKDIHQEAALQQSAVIAAGTPAVAIVSHTHTTAQDGLCARAPTIVFRAAVHARGANG